MLIIIPCPKCQTAVRQFTGFIPTGQIFFFHLEVLFASCSSQIGDAHDNEIKHDILSK